MIGDTFADVLSRAQEGDGAAIEAIYRDLSPVVHGYLRANGAREPEDLTGDAFVDVIRGIAGFTGDERHFRSWVLTIAHRRLIDDFRRRGRRQEFPVAPEELGTDLIDLTSGEGEAMTRLHMRGALQALGQLTEDQRTVFFLRVFADLSVLEVARVVGKPETAVKALQRRAVSRMRRLMQGEMDDAVDDALGEEPTDGPRR